MIEVGRPSQEKLRTQPPVGNVDAFLRCLEGNADCPEIIPAINIPLDLVALPLRGEGLEPVGFGNAGAFLVRSLLVSFVVAMVGVEDVLKFANLMLEISGAYLDVIQMCIWRVRERGSACMFGLRVRLKYVPFSFWRNSGKGCLNLSAKEDILSLATECEEIALAVFLGHQLSTRLILMEVGVGREWRGEEWRQQDEIR